MMPDDKFRRAFFVERSPQWGLFLTAIRRSGGTKASALQAVDDHRYGIATAEAQTGQTAPETPLLQRVE